MLRGIVLARVARHRVHGAVARLHALIQIRALRLQSAHYLAHLGPPVRGVAHAGRGHLHHAEHLLLVIVVLQRRVGDHVQIPVLQRLRQHGPGPLHEALLAGGLRHVHGFLARDQLQQHHPERVHVRFVGELTAQGVLRSQVTEGAHDSRGHVRVRLVGQLGQAEVRDLGFEAVVEQNVGRLDIPVDDLGVTVLVQVAQAPGGSQGDLHPRRPVDDRHVLPVQGVLQSAVGHEVIHQQPLAVRNAVAHQRNQMPVVHSADDLHLGPELPLALASADRQLLHCHQLIPGHHALVHSPESSLAQKIVSGESIRGHFELLVREPRSRIASAR
ncbi:hypothetical protein Mapa_004190 [Marchantia paleacea]|nr:hypothetical protein Mapa_004190 [Marchantia paleacea]